MPFETATAAPRKVAVIGAGPSGMSLLYHLERLRREGREGVPEVVCYEKQAAPGGLWNYDWRTGTLWPLLIY